jgi:hypothetical protein
MPLCCHAHFTEAHAALAPSLSCAPRRQLYLRCDPVFQCSSSGDNSALTCVPLTQARIAAISYVGQRVTCEVICVRV